MKRCNRVVLKTEDSEISKETGRKVMIKDQKINKTNVDSKNYKKPPIPKGYKHVCGEWNNGFVIKRGSDGSEFVWVPVGHLDSNGTLDGVTFNKKFGIRNYMEDIFPDRHYFEVFTTRITFQLKSVEKYGGFYISRYNISQNEKTGKPQSVKGEYPWVDIDFDKAMEVAATFERKDGITSHLPFGVEYDSLLESLITSGAKTFKDIAVDSADWGNYLNAEDSAEGLEKTGSNKTWCANNIYDLAGNVPEWTQEVDDNDEFVIRGGGYNTDGDDYPVACRNGQHFYRNNDHSSVGFRVALQIE